MRLILLASVYPPQRSSGAVQMRDLSTELVRQGHEVTMLVPSPSQKEMWRIEKLGGVRVVYLKSLPTTDQGYLRRTIGEVLMPFLMLLHWRAAPLKEERWDGVVWYSPTIFLGPVVHALKSFSGCRSYLILRDIFPEWAVDMGLMREGSIPYRFFKAVADYQYAVADVIGIQTDGNRPYFRHWEGKKHKRLEVLQNWLTAGPDAGCSIDIGETSLAGRHIFVYAGNMGIAQGIWVLMELAVQLRTRSDIGFVFVGRGSEVKNMREYAERSCLDNVLIFDEVDPDEIPGLYSQCHVGLLALDPRHKTHNIPGKFLSYMQAGLPVLAVVNADNDIVTLIEREGVGQVCTDQDAAALVSKALKLLDGIKEGEDYSGRCRRLASREYSSEVAARQIIHALEAENA